ncbi:DinB family protein [Ammoniphilus sp. YIM 78166]|uniref:DinB family protein n=1 Tax=Ammoniphilus sp. YIM 78166 TaxID=1644106 RepID=UPI001F0F8601|nr:DinB family protein [Ammoniphilus sp. YIM 78166]
MVKSRKCLGVEAMELIPKKELIAHFEGVRKRTLNYAREIPEELIDWRPGEDKFSIGDIIRHLGSAELMFLHAITEKEWKYPGHGLDKGRTKQEVLHYLQACHSAVMSGLHALEEEHLTAKVKNGLGYEISAWRLIMAMAEHEIHHRGQLSAYMQANQVNPPQIFGLRIEQIPQ